MPLQHKYRPTTWKQVVGNQAVISALVSSLTRDEQIPHAFLFTGPAGTGKTTLARLVAQQLGAYGMDFIEMNAADFRGIDMVRELRNKAQLKPMSGGVRVWLLDECHMLTADAQEAALKLLEEPPAHAFFCLATTEPHKLKQSLIRRCHHSQLEPLSERELIGLMKSICEDDGVDIDKPALQHIAQISCGSPGMALSILDRVMDVPANQMDKLITSTAAQLNESIELCRLLIKRTAWSTLCEIIKGLQKQDAERVRQHVMAYAMSCLLNKDSARAALIISTLRDNHPGFGVQWPALVASLYEIAVD